MILQTIADLRTTAGAPDEYARVLGYHAAADGGGGDFYWDSTSVETDNGGTVFEVSGTATGRWYRIYEHQVNPRWFGAKGDGSNNDSPAFQQMVDFCEQKGVKDVKIPFGDFYLDESVFVRIGGIKFIGEGSLLREESWWETLTTTYPGVYGNYDNEKPYKGASLIIKHNISGIVYAPSVCDSVYWRGVGFRTASGERAVGTTYAIDFRSEFWGPTWPFQVHECHFRGFNRVFNFGGPSLYNIARVDITHCAFSQNDEVFYQGFKDNPTNHEPYSRYICWGFNFQHNCAHHNSRVIYGFFGKDLVTISNNNLEGNIPYSNTTMAPYIVDIEIDNCAVDFYGNHLEGISTDAVSVSSLRKNVDGSYKETDNTTALFPSHYVNIHGNDFTGLGNHKSYTLSGSKVKINEVATINVHACDILENSFADIYLTDYALVHGSVIKFANQTWLNSNFLKNTHSCGAQLFDNAVFNNSLFLDDKGEQWAKTKKSGFGFGLLHEFTGSSKFCIATYKIRNNGRHNISHRAFHYFQRDVDLVTNSNAYIISGTSYPPYGEYLAVCVFPTNDAFYSNSNNKFSPGLVSEPIGTESAQISSSIFMYTTQDSNPQIMPVFEQSNIVVEQGTFESGQNWHNGTDRRMAISSGTLGLLSGVDVINESDNKVELTDTSSLSQGQFIIINGNNYRIIELRGNWATLDNKPPASVLGASVSFQAPSIVTL